MSASKKDSYREFDQTVCFTFFAGWGKTIRAIGEHDPAAAHAAFLVLMDYCLYGIEPDPATNPWGVAWGIVETEAYQSIKNRRRRFGGKDVSKREEILAFHERHPEASQRAIAGALRCSVGTVNDALKTLKNQCVETGVLNTKDKDTDTGKDTHLVSVLKQNDDNVLGPSCPSEKEADR